MFGLETLTATGTKKKKKHPDSGFLRIYSSKSSTALNLCPLFPEPLPRSAEEFSAPTGLSHIPFYHFILLHLHLFQVRNQILKKRTGCRG